MKNDTAPGDQRATYAICGLTWGCSLKYAEGKLAASTTLTVGECYDASVLRFESAESGYRVQGEVHFTCGALTKIVTTCTREDDGAPEPAEFFGNLSSWTTAKHGPYEVDGIDQGQIVRQWPSDERGGLRMTFDIITREVVASYYSGLPG